MDDRPLTSVGDQQARDLVRRLRDAPIERLLSSPVRRCRLTLEPLADALELPCETEERLREGTSTSDALALIRELDATPAVLCSHADVIPALLERLAWEGLEIEGRGACATASLWHIETRATGRLVARYYPA